MTELAGSNLVNFLATSSLIVSLCSLGNAFIWFVGIFATAAPSKMKRWERGTVCALMAAIFLSLFFSRGVDWLVLGVIRFVTEGGGGPAIVVFEVARGVYVLCSIGFWFWVIHILRRDYTNR